MNATEKPVKLIRLWVYITERMKQQGHKYVEPDFVKPENVDHERDSCRCYEVSLPANYHEILGSNGRWRLWDSDHKTIPTQYGRYLPTCYAGYAYVMARVDEDGHDLLLITITDADNQTSYKVKRFKLERLERYD